MFEILCYCEKNNFVAITGTKINFDFSNLTIFKMILKECDILDEGKDEQLFLKYSKCVKVLKNKFIIKLWKMETRYKKNYAF